MIVAALLLGAAQAPAQKTVAEAVSIALGTGGAGPRPPLVGAAIDDSVDGETWNLIFVGAGLQAERRIVSITDGKVQPDAPRAVWPFSTGNYDTLRNQEIGMAVASLRRLAAERATRMNIKPASLKYVLNRRAGEVFAVWDVYLVDRKRIVIGHIRLDASSGSILKEEFSAGNTSGTQPPAPQTAAPQTVAPQAAPQTVAPQAAPQTVTPQAAPQPTAASQPEPHLQRSATGRTVIQISR